MANTWRDVARPIIAEVIRACGPGCDEKFLRKAISGTYPFGERKYWPYKVWCDEVNRQLRPRVGRPSDPPDPRQEVLF